MTAYEYLNALREALGVLPDEERANAIRYYEEYFLDAGPENEGRVIQELGAPEEVAQQILNDYKEVARVAQPSGAGQDAEGAPHFGEEPPRGFRQEPFAPPHRSPAMQLLTALAVLFFGVVIGVPLLAGLAATVVGLAVGALALLAGLVVTALLLLIILPLALVACGVVMCVLALFLWASPASAVLTFGAGLCLLALGGMLTVGCISVCAACFRPLMRAGGWCVEQCGRFFRWCAGLVRRFLDCLKGV